MANPTIAKELAIYFFSKKEWKVTSSTIKIQIIQAKRLLDAGFTQEEIMYGIDKCYTSMYSLGYLLLQLNKILDERNIPTHQYNTIQIKEGGEGDNTNSTKNNQRKMAGFHDESRLREKCNLDLFKKPGEDN